MAPDFQSLTPPKIDAVDLHILDVLQTDARATLRHIGDRVGVAASTVSNRIDELETAGVIEGYAPQVNYPALGFEEAAVFRLQVSTDAIDAISAEIARYPTITEILSVTGRHDLLAIGYFPGLNPVRTLTSDLSALDGVTQVTTDIVLDIHASDRQFQRLPVGLRHSDRRWPLPDGAVTPR